MGFEIVAPAVNTARMSLPNCSQLQRYAEACAGNVRNCLFRTIPEWRRVCWLLP